MSETKWSPGPWSWHGPEDNIHVVQEGDPGMRVCFLTSNGPTEANAHLIAAAPALYDALYAVIYWRQQIDSTFGDRDANDKAINNTIANERIAMEVLARARGEAA